MSVRNYVPVDVDDLPETFEYDLDGDTYELSFDYNDEATSLPVRLPMPIIMQL
nr:hypothetical protein [Lentilactobacillus rapi]